MKVSKYKILKYLLLGVIATLLATLLTKKESQKSELVQKRDYPEIIKEGVIRIATEYNTTAFYVVKDTIAGFHYRLVQEFAKLHKLQTEITPIMDFQERLDGLLEGKFDLIAYDLAPTPQLREKVLFTRPLSQSKQILVQRKDSAGQEIRNLLDLAGKTIFVVENSPARLRINNLSDEIADTIYIREIPKYGPEQLLSLVAHGDIDFAVCDESIAMATIDSFPQLDIKTPIGFTQLNSWVVRKSSTQLLDSLNAWIESIYKK